MLIIPVPLRNQAERLAESVHEEVGDGLRGVLSYTHTGEIEIHHLRADIGDAPNQIVREKQIQEYLIDMLVADTQEERFALGALNCTVRFFDEATVLNFTFDGKTGVVVSLDPNIHIISREFITHCKDHMR